MAVIDWLGWFDGYIYCAVFLGWCIDYNIMCIQQKRKEP